MISCYLPAAEQPVGKNGEDAGERNEEDGQARVIPGVWNTAHVWLVVGYKVGKHKKEHAADKGSGYGLVLSEQDAA